MSRYDKLFPYWPEGRELLSRIVDSTGEPPIIKVSPSSGDGKTIVISLMNPSSELMCCIPPEHIRTFINAAGDAEKEFICLCQAEAETILMRYKGLPFNTTMKLSITEDIGKLLRHMGDSGLPTVKQLLRKHCGLEE